MNEGIIEARNWIVPIFVALFGGGFFLGVINLIYASKIKKRDEERKHADGRLQDWISRAEKYEARIEKLEADREADRRKIAALEQYIASLVDTIRRQDSTVVIPPKPN